MQRTALFLSTLAALALVACGGGSAGVAPPPAPPAETLALGVAGYQTLAGGKPITLNAASGSGAAPSWQLASGAPGSLSAASGASVSYTPPAGVAANTAVTVTASVGGLSKSTTLTVFPEPGPAGMTILGGRLDSVTREAPVDGAAADSRFRESLALAADPQGNLYVAGTCRMTQTYLQSLTLRKIARDGVVSTLASCETQTWFGQPDNDHNTRKIHLPRGLAVDRAGNIYVATYVGSTTAGTSSVETRGVYKITPQGLMTMLAGVEGTHIAALVDGKGGNARLLTPEIAGIDGDGNLYLLDQDGSVVRKITPDGDVSTVAALPAAFNTDQAGNSYRADAQSGDITQTTPAGVARVIANTRSLPGTQPNMSPATYGLTRTGPATYALVVNNGYSFANEVIVRLVVPH